MLNLNELFPSIFSSIPHLFGSSRPSNISGLVISVVVYAIYCMGVAGRISDVSIESLEVFSPFRADFNTSASIIGKMRMALAATSFFHALPRSPDFCSVHSVDEIGFCKMRNGVVEKQSAVFFPETTAGNGMSSSEIAGVNPARFAAFANAEPIPLWTMGGCGSGFELVCNSQPAENFPS